MKKLLFKRTNYIILFVRVTNHPQNRPKQVRTTTQSINFILRFDRKDTFELLGTSINLYSRPRVESVVP